ncbi:xanthine dehydrogenase accessory protein XdhC [Pelagimonas varians]|uniref:XdhC and CoxI family protein n=1 Tax=Pelagimonas varians TaxID=696760 RepID=A0A238KQR2_9RHOB|nr:xanthine dehydrogenase accessory protein XdhC [Pelagimonas varians]PYG28517.1 molybdenum cofactor sulfurylase [Pelagimonas varians]SMX45007.1 XdhC and CoxI family protein [Pelagimonas varians]
MGFDLNGLQRAVEQHGTVARVVIADVAGSSPREVGAAMLVWQGGQSGTIGGGALEYQTAQHALTRLGLSRHSLGPELGQCCGGSVTLLTELYTPETLACLTGQDIITRGASDMPLAVRRVLDQARAQGKQPDPQLIQGWMIEPVLRPTRDIWIWGAGHVGRAMVDVLTPMPDTAITWIDTASDRFPDAIPNGVTKLPAADPPRLMAHAPKTALHLILTYSHELDFQLCHAALVRGFAFAGLIGSDTKWTRFRKRLAVLGHGIDQIESITCPIGRKDLGKHPQAIAIGVAAQLLTLDTKGETAWTTHSSAFKA